MTKFLAFGNVFVFTSAFVAFTLYWYDYIVFLFLFYVFNDLFTSIFDG